MRSLQSIRPQIASLLTHNRVINHPLGVEVARWLCALALVFFHQPWGWRVGLLTGLLAILVGGGQLLALHLAAGSPGSARPAPQSQPEPASATPLLFAGQAAIAPGRGQGLVLPPATPSGPAGPLSGLGTDQPAAQLPAAAQSGTALPASLIPALAALGGGSVLLGVLAGRVLPLFITPQAAVTLSLYIAAPTLLLWAAGELLGFLPRIWIRPRGWRENLGLAKSGLQVLGACLLWVALGLRGAAPALGALAWVGLACAAVGIYLGLLAASSSAPE